jgi:hypothetical protein
MIVSNKLSPTEWDAARGDVDCDRNGAAASPLRLDFHIRLEQDNYVIDVFDGATSNADEAYLTSHECDTWEQAESDETRRGRCRRNAPVWPRVRRHSSRLTSVSSSICEKVCAGFLCR